jgi:hypothetical protein
MILTPTGNACFVDLHHSESAPVDLRSDIQTTVTLKHFLPHFTPRYLSVLPTDGTTFRRVHIAPGSVLPITTSFTLDDVVMMEE